MRSDVVYFALYRRDGQVRAADASALVGKKFPKTISVDGRTYRITVDEDTFVFWDELLDESDRVVGFTFIGPSHSFDIAQLWPGSSNVLVDAYDTTIELAPGLPHRYDCTQGFDSKVYRAIDDQNECVMLMFNWSGREPGFELTGDLA
jgi:hypothetical protein